MIKSAMIATAATASIASKGKLGFETSSAYRGSYTTSSKDMGLFLLLQNHKYHRADTVACEITYGAVFYTPFLVLGVGKSK